MGIVSGEDTTELVAAECGTVASEECCTKRCAALLEGRHVMFLEKEGRFGEVVVPFEQAQAYAGNSEWYLRKRDHVLKEHPSRRVLA